MARYTSPTWRDFRRALLAEQQECLACARTKRLEAHHLIYRGVQVRGITEKPGDCVVLCLRCHKVLHNKFGYEMLTEELKARQEKWISARRRRYDRLAKLHN